ncbi:MAG: membrane protein insertase YidC [Micrococcales bacterium]|nr:membrane protein insertase YidC [Micrococcales bacterium]
MSWFDSLLWPIMVAVAWIMTTFHSLLSAIGLDPAGGAAWALSIVGLVIVIRILLIPLFVRQIRATRGMQLLQPELQAIQKKYKGKTDPASREALSRETMELYRKHNTNPFSSCLPILLQSPIFFALFRVLNSLVLLSQGQYAGGAKTHIGTLSQQLASQAESATIFGAPLSGVFMHAQNTPTRVVTVVLIVAMSVTTFTTQRQLTRKNMPPAALEGPMAQQQKMLLYVMPLIFAFSGVNFPIGVLIYWTVTNVWSMGQQFFAIRRMPAPGSEAERLMNERRARKAERHGGVVELTESLKPEIEERPRSGQRQQPVRKDRQRAGRPGAGVVGGSAQSMTTDPSVVETGSRPAESQTTRGTSAKSGGAADGSGDGVVSSGGRDASRGGSGRLEIPAGGKKRNGSKSSGSGSQRRA